ncbi:MAG: SynChlorMet cassette protein ScmC [candidate division WOR-3 bacterium]|nr:SynChlorMet cassette protein ScmC [candidate division WOR-3 bacterium]
MTESDFALVLADGSSWVIRGLDAEAEATVLELGRVMQLSPAQGGRELCVVSGWNGARGPRGAAKGRLFCRLGPARDRHTEVLRMERIATTLVDQSLAGKGLLLHGALAVRDGFGFILAGPSGVGKTTASRRLPSPWRSFSDDCVLVVRDADDRYWAHPWPTWSRLRDNRPAESWPVGRAVPLKALLFLKQSPFDRAEPVAITPATALIMESAFQLERTVTLTSDGYASRAICRKYLRAAWILAAAVPAFRLRISLAGQFWNEIERAVPTEPRMHCRTGAAEANADGHRCGPRTEQNSETRKQNAELGNAGDADERGKVTNVRRTRIVPEPPRRLLSGSPKPRLVLFQPRHRTFLKLVKGRRVVGSANDVLREWHPKSTVHSSKSKVQSPQSR